MNQRDLYVGTTVYHTIFTHWGKGTVIKCQPKDFFGYKVADKWLVRWEGMPGFEKYAGKQTKCSAMSLRKTFDQAKHEAFLVITGKRKA